ncbi:MAG: BadF/BadG/BcrA/BcrD ATPase family protein [Steroidobacter sp.]
MFLGIDGGGTKTAYAVIDAEGRVRARHIGPSASHLAIGIPRAQQTLLDGIRAVLAQAVLTPADLTYAFIGLPSYGEDSATTPGLDAMPSALLATSRYRCDSDMVCSWAGSLDCADGISVIAGTGSMAYGQYRGRTARSGGWGEIIGDEGSAYWIAREGMNLFSRMSDGRATRGPLYDLVRQRLALSLDLDLCAHVYGTDANTRGSFAQFAPLVHAAALAGDSQAVAIFHRAAAELIECVLATRRSLQVPDDEVMPVSHTGSVLEGATLLLEAFKQGVAIAAPSFEYRAPRYSPDIGAARFAARLSGVQI